MQSRKGDDFFILVSDSFPRIGEQCVDELPFRCWLARKMEEGRLAVMQAIERFNFDPAKGHTSSTNGAVNMPLKQSHLWQV